MPGKREVRKDNKDNNVLLELKKRDQDLLDAIYRAQEDMHDYRIERGRLVYQCLRAGYKAREIAEALDVTEALVWSIRKAYVNSQKESVDEENARRERSGKRGS